MQSFFSFITDLWNLIFSIPKLSAYFNRRVEKLYRLELTWSARWGWVGRGEPCLAPEIARGSQVFSAGHTFLYNHQYILYKHPTSQWRKYLKSICRKMKNLHVWLSIMFVTLTGQINFLNQNEQCTISCYFRDWNFHKNHRGKTFWLH